MEKDCWEEGCDCCWGCCEPAGMCGGCIVESAPGQGGRLCNCRCCDSEEGRQNARNGVGATWGMPKQWLDTVESLSGAHKNAIKPTLRMGTTRCCQTRFFDLPTLEKGRRGNNRLGDNGVGLNAVLNGFVTEPKGQRAHKSQGSMRCSGARKEIRSRA